MRFLHLACAFATLLQPPSAESAIIAWQAAQPLTPNSFVDQQGDTFTRLDLRCDATVDECKWRITTQFFIADGSSSGYSLWIRDPAGAATRLSISETSVDGAPHTDLYWAHENLGGVLAGRLSDIMAWVPPNDPSIPAGPTIYNLHSYVLTSQAGVAPGTLTQLRAGSDGFWGLQPGHPGDPYRVVAFGANPGFQIAGGEWPNPVIHINYVPEPTTAAMLLAPAVLLLRRRRSRRT